MSEGPGKDPLDLNKRISSHPQPFLPLQTEKVIIIKEIVTQLSLP